MEDKLQTAEVSGEVDRVQELVEATLRQAKFLSRTHVSRELSLVITKLEEACLWFTKVG